MPGHAGFADAAEAGQRGIPVSVNHIGPMAGVFFNPGPVNSFAAVMASDAQRYARFFHAMLASGVYLAPSPYEALFISSAHGAAEMDKATDAVRTALAGL